MNEALSSQVGISKYHTLKRLFPENKNEGRLGYDAINTHYHSNPAPSPSLLDHNDTDIRLAPLLD